AAALSGNLREGAPHMFGHGFDKAGVIVKNAELVDVRRLWPHSFASPRDVLEILPASGVRAVCRHHERDRAANAIRPHTAQSVGKHRMPVAVPPIYGQHWTPLAQL